MLMPAPNSASSARLLVDLHLETLVAQRDGCRQAAEARSDNSNATCLSHLMLRDQNDSRESLTSPSLPLNRPVTVGVCRGYLSAQTSFWG